MTIDFKDFFDYLIINSPPVYSIDGCIAAAFFDDDDGDFKTKESIIERFRACVYLCGEEELAFLQLAADLNEKKEAWKENVETHPFRVFAFSYFVYLFSDDDNLYLVLPDELAEIYRRIISEENFAQVNLRNRELCDYAAALCNLYGAYETEQFAAVWNRHQKDKITIEEANTFLYDRSCFNSDYYIYDDFVVHDCLFADDFEELYEEVADIEYYMPSKSVIKAYSTKGYDDSLIVGQKEMDGFLAEYIENERILDDLQLMIAMSCERLETPEYISDMLTGAGVPISNTDFREKFERLYNTLRDNTHIWELRGFTPHQYKTATGKTLVRFALPKIKQKKK